MGQRTRTAINYAALRMSVPGQQSPSIRLELLSALLLICKYRDPEGRRRDLSACVMNSAVMEWGIIKLMLRS